MRSTPTGSARLIIAPTIPDSGVWQWLRRMLGRHTDADQQALLVGGGRILPVELDRAADLSVSRRRPRWGAPRITRALCAPLPGPASRCLTTGPRRLVAQRSPATTSAFLQVTDRGARGHVEPLRSPSTLVDLCGARVTPP